MNYMVGDFDGKTVFLHECEWVRHNGPIPKDKLVFHKDGDTRNCSINNLELVDENKDHGDLHSYRPFHEESIDKSFIGKHFPDILKKIILSEA